jgi:protein-tyrosine phosphatase
MDVSLEPEAHRFRRAGASALEGAQHHRSLDGLDVSGDPDVGVLFVCTGNQCRSPMAEAMLRNHLRRSTDPVTVASAGFVSEGLLPPPEVIEALDDLGIDLSDHRSQMVTPTLITGAGLVVGMARQHVIDLALMAPDAWVHCFTFADLIRRADSCGPRRRSESVRDWAQRISADRTRVSLVNLPVSEDIRDPMGGRRQDYELARDDLASRTGRLAALLSSA